jgi:hypothetical protein
LFDAHLDPSEANERVLSEALESALARPLAASRGATSWFLKPRYDPHRSAVDVRWTALLTPTLDLLRARYEVGGLRLTLTESRNMLVLSVAKGLSAARAAELFARVFDSESAELGRSWRFELDPVTASDTAQRRWLRSVGAPAFGELHSRDERAELVLEAERSAFVVHKRSPQRIGLPPAASWFSEAARAALRAAR